MMVRRGAVVALVFAGCTPAGSLAPVQADTASNDTAPPETTPPVETDEPDPTTDTFQTLGETGSTDTSTVGCVLPPAPTSWTYIDDVPVSEDFAFDELGNMVNVDQGPDALFRTPYLGLPELLAPYSSSEVAGVAFTLDGRLALADEGNGALVLLGLDGTTTVLNGAMDQPNSITVDDQGFIYITAYDKIQRVDPVTGVGTTLLVVPDSDLDGLVFSPDFRRLWFNYDEDSIVGFLDLDAYGNVLASQATVNLPEFGGELDGMAADECGNVYAIATDGSLFRVLADASQAELLITLSGVAGMTTSSLHFGSGIGGWASDHLFVMNRYGGIFEVEIGLNGRKEPHLP